MSKFQKQWEKRAMGSAGSSARSKGGSRPASGLLGQADQLRREGGLEEAIGLYRRHLQEHPNDARAYEGMATTFGIMGRLAEAEANYLRALELDPALLRASIGLSGARAARGDTVEAARALAAAMQTHEKNPEALAEIGDAFLRLGAPDKAANAFGQAAKMRPNEPEYEFKRARALHVVHRNDEALAGYRKALRLRRDLAPAHGNIAAILGEAGHFEEAREGFATAAHHAGKDRAGWLFRRALLVPVIPESNEQIDQSREQTLQELSELTRKGVRLQDPFHEVGAANFYFAYQGRQDRVLQEAIARAYLAACPSLAAELAPTGRRSSRRLKVGICSAFLREHTIGRVTQGLVDKLPRSKFQVVLLRTQPPGDPLAHQLDKSADKSLLLPASLDAARKIVAEENLDVLYYPDIGQEPFTYFLAYARLAPVQIAGWGHPVTTGIPNVDYYLSTSHFEPEGAAEHYSEQLIRLSRLYAYMYRPTGRPAAMTKAALGLPEDCKLYLCAQSLFKVHPDFDQAIGAILAADPTGRFALFQMPEPTWQGLLMERFRRSIPDHADRVSFLPRLELDQFMGVLAAADAVVDTRHFTGGYTTYLCFHLGVPVVTWEGEAMRGRLTHGLYQQIGVEGLSAADTTQFSALAVRIATDPALQKRYSEEIRRAAGVLFEDRAAVTEFGAFLEAACEAGGGQKKLKEWSCGAVSDREARRTGFFDRLFGRRDS